MSISERNADGAKHSSAQAGTGQPNWLIEERYARLLKHIDEFLLLDGASGPVEAINTLVVEFLARQDPEEPDNGNYIADTVFTVNTVSNFLVKLSEERIQMSKIINSLKS